MSEPAAKRQKLETLDDACDVISGVQVFKKDVLERVLARYGCPKMCTEFEGYYNFRKKTGYGIALKTYLALVKPGSHGTFKKRLGNEAAGFDGYYDMENFMRFVFVYSELDSFPHALLDDFLKCIHPRRGGLETLFYNVKFERAATRFVALFEHSVDWANVAPHRNLPHENAVFVDTPGCGSVSVQKRALDACPKSMFEEPPMWSPPTSSIPRMYTNVVEHTFCTAVPVVLKHAFKLLAYRAGRDGTCIPFHVSDRSLNRTSRAKFKSVYFQYCRQFHNYGVMLRLHVVEECEFLLLKPLRVLVASYLPVFRLLKE